MGADASMCTCMQVCTSMCKCVPACRAPRLTLGIVPNHSSTVDFLKKGLFIKSNMANLPSHLAPSYQGGIIGRRCA